MVTIPTTEPAEIQAGDTIQWKKTLSDYPASSGWVLSYTLINAAAKITITGTASGDDHLVSVTAATSAGYGAGTYAWQAVATLGSARYTVGSGTMTVKANLAAATTLDNRTHVKKTLDAIEAVIENRASMDQQAYTIEGRSLTRTPMADLIKLRDKYNALYLQEQNAEAVNAGRGGKNRIFVRF